MRTVVGHNRERTRKEEGGKEGSRKGIYEIENILNTQISNLDIFQYGHANPEPTRTGNVPFLILSGSPSIQHDLCIISNSIVLFHVLGKW